MGEVNKRTLEIVEMIGKLEPQEFIGICKILGVDLVLEDSIEEKRIVKDEEGKDVEIDVHCARSSEQLINDVIDKIAALNRTQARNLKRLLKAATKGR